MCLARAEQLQSKHLRNNLDFPFPCKESAGASLRSYFPILCPHGVDKKLGYFVCRWFQGGDK